MPGILILSSGRNKDWDFFGYWVDHAPRCYKHFDKRRDPRRYQPAAGLDFQHTPCPKCLKEKTNYYEN